MSIGRMDRRWLAIGALGASVLLAASWFLLIGPQRSQASSLHQQAEDSLLSQVGLQRRMVELRQQSLELPAYQLQLKKDQSALPAAPELSAFLRELQAASKSAKVSVSGLVVGVPEPAAVSTANIYALKMTLTATGNIAGLNQFLDELQQTRPRAVLITDVDTVPAGEGGSLSGQVTLNLGLRAFVAPAPEPAATPTPTK